MRGFVPAVLGSLILVAVACGGETPPAESPGQPSPAREETADDVEQASLPAARRQPDREQNEEKAPPKEPEFTDKMSVAEAINAVPAGIPRLNIEQETLGEPLKDPKTWAACKLGPGDHFKVNVAIWNGRAVGVDLETKSPRIAGCIDKTVRSITWRDKVRSLNTVEYAQ